MSQKRDFSVYAVGIAFSAMIIITAGLPMASGCENDAVRVNKLISNPPVVTLECGDTYNFSEAQRSRAVVYRCQDGQVVRRDDLIECRCVQNKETP